MLQVEWAQDFAGRESATVGGYQLMVYPARNGGYCADYVALRNGSWFGACHPVYDGGLRGPRNPWITADSAKAAVIARVAPKVNA